MKAEQIKEITEKATEQLIASLQAGQSEALTRYLKAIGRFHRYSLYNVLLIASQKPNASYVAGFRTWNELGRFVKKGEKGILILAPIVRRRAENEEDGDEASASTAGFRAAHVFDVNQTDGQEMPQIGIVQGDPCGYRERLHGFANAQESRSNTHPRSRPRAVRRAAVTSSCFPGSRQRKSFQHWRTSWRMNSSTGAIAAAPHRAESARPKRRLRRSSSATPSGSKPVRPHPTISSCGMETPGS